EPAKGPNSPIRDRWTESVEICAATVPTMGRPGFVFGHTRTRRFLPWTFRSTYLHLAVDTGPTRFSAFANDTSCALAAARAKELIRLFPTRLKGSEFKRFTKP